MVDHPPEEICDIKVLLMDFLGNMGKEIWSLNPANIRKKK